MLCGLQIIPKLLVPSPLLPLDEGIFIIIIITIIVIIIKHGKSVENSTSAIFNPKNLHEKRVNPSIFKFATKQRNSLNCTLK